LILKEKQVLLTRRSDQENQGAYEYSYNPQISIDEEQQIIVG